MKTEKLYDLDSHVREFQGTVLDCRPGTEKTWAVVLDRTCFFPEGGGQPGDRGTLNGMNVLDTREEDGALLHITDGPLAPGTSVAGAIDWDLRFDRMQQHSGEHMVSGIVHSRFGYNNVGFHMGADVLTIDFSGILTEEELAEVEREVNRRILRDSPVKVWYPGPQDLASLPYRSKKELKGDVRLVEFPGTDLCACCGTHVARTGEIGLVKILSVEKFHSGVRVTLVCGGRAEAYLDRVYEQNREISRQLSAKPLETAAAVERLGAELEAKKQRIYGLEAALFAAKARELRDAGDVLVFMEELSPDSLRRCAVQIQETCGGRAAVFSGSDGQGYKYAVGLPGGDLRDWGKALNQALNGRGGGKPGFMQGSVQAARAEIEAYFAE